MGDDDSDAAYVDPRDQPGTPSFINFFDTSPAFVHYLLQRQQTNIFFANESRCLLELESALKKNLTMFDLIMFNIILLFV